YLPPLRERMGDIRLLATEFLARFAKENQKTISAFTDEAWAWILSYDWPGNVRELKNAVERAVIMARGERIDAQDLMPRHIRNSGVTSVLTLPAGSTVAEARRHIVVRKFADAGGDLARAARAAGMAESEMRAELLKMMGADGARNGVSDDVKDVAPPTAGAAPAARKKAAAKPRERKATGK